MAISVTTAASRITANAAAVATAMAGGTTTAEATGLGLVLTALSKRPDIMDMVIALAFSTQVTPASSSIPTGTNQISPG